jgi:hypothetical protein
MTAGRDPLAAIRNLAGKAWRRAATVRKQGVRLVRRAERLSEQVAVFRTEWDLSREIAAVSRSRQPIIAGPWLSEVGFEVLYWIPFLRWFEDRYRVDRERVVAISRGGVSDWYADVAGRYVEIFDHMDPRTFARRNAERRTRDEAGGQKQTTTGPLDEELIETARRATGIDAADVCHPSLMYRLFNRFWFGNRALDLVTSHTKYLPPAVSRARIPGLPDEYVAAKFYTGAALPDIPGCRRALREIVASISEQIPVVLLNTGLAMDEHEDYLFRDLRNVMSLGDHLTPATNLGVQTQVIAGARGFVGTCGSLAWLAPMLGVDTVAVYAEDRFLLSHMFFATQVYRQMGAARFDTLDLRAAMHLELLTAAAAEEVWP